MNERREGAKGRRGGGAKQGARGTDTMQQGHQQREQQHPDTKSLKNPPSTTRTTPPPIEKNHFGFANFLRVAIYNPITQYI